MLISGDRDVRVWLADLTHTDCGRPANDTVPLGAAFIASYLAAIFPEGTSARLFKYPARLAAALETEGAPNVIGFSSYLWNTRLSRWFAQVIKRMSPETVVVFGGPNLPLGQAEKCSYLASAPEIDFFIEGEAEVAVGALIGILAAADWNAAAARGRAPSTHSIEMGRLRSAPMVARLRDLDVIPSPYTSGLLDEFLDGFLVPTVQTNRGCPFTCSFCVEGSDYFSKVACFSPERVETDLRYIAQIIQPSLRSGGRNELMITDSNFAMYRADAQVCSVIGELSQTQDWPRRVNVTTGKNRRERVLSALKLANNRIQLTGAVQSLDEEVLRHARRSNISVDDLLAVARDAAETGTNTYSDVILGLPGDSIDAHMETVLTLVDGGFGRINSYQFALLPGAALDTPESRARYRLSTMFRVVPRAFGRYRVWTHEAVSAEVDEICVGSDTLDFDGYIRCRLLDLMLCWFHNDGVFLATEAAVRRLGGKVSSWLAHIEHRKTWPPAIASMRTAFIKDSRLQLFDTAEAVVEDVCRHIDSYLNDERGNNLLYSYRARALLRAVPALTDVAREAAIAVTRAAGCDVTLIDDATRFDSLALANILNAEASPRETAHFAHDILALLEDANVDDQRLRPGEGVVIAFNESPVGAEFATYHHTMGSSIDAVGRALSRVMIRDLRRSAEYCSQPQAG